ncbi:hypothetical protein SDC9_53573 [bioreactor metagenome]|uniref:Uncharacterized protein n=1 Tax=bioreactor metagenome TaxID=1076179 RepID=A0A644WUA6_9ZZZZ
MHCTLDVPIRHVLLLGLETHGGIIHAKRIENPFLQELRERDSRKVFYKHLCDRKAIIAVGGEGAGIVLEI